MNYLDHHVASLAKVDDEAVGQRASTDVRDRLLAEIVNDSEPRKSLPGRHLWRRSAIVFASVGALTATTAFAVVALKGTSSRDITSTQCRTENNDLIIPATTGDPVTDCEAEWQNAFGSPAPELKAYEAPGKAVLVLPADASPPSGYVLMAPGPTQNTALIQLDEGLSDYVGGLSSRCFTQAAAVARTQSELSRLGLRGWSVVTRGVPANGTSSCESYVVNDPVKHTVLLGSDLPSQLEPGDPSDRLAKALRVVQKQCASLSETATAVQKAAAAVGWTQANRGLDLKQVVTEGASCTRIYFQAGGSALVTLRGPA